MHAYRTHNCAQLRAADVGRSGYESVAELNADTELKTKLEALRLTCGQLMGLGDVSKKTYPKMTLIAPPREGGSLTTRSFIPHVCHDAIGVLAAGGAGDGRGNAPNKRICRPWREANHRGARSLIVIGRWFPTSGRG